MPDPQARLADLHIAKNRVRSWIDQVLQAGASELGEAGRIETSRWAERLAGIRRGAVEFGTERFGAMAAELEVTAEYADVRLEREPGWIWDRVRAEDARTGATVVVDGLRKRDAVSAQAALRASSILHSVGAANRALDALLERDSYLNRGAYVRWRETAVPLLEGGGESIIRNAASLPVSEVAKHEAQRFIERIDRGEDLVRRRNDQYASSVLERYGALFDSAESNPLTPRQREAIVHDEDASLVVAGAGTGKTSTVVGKVAFLLRHERLRPDEILLLAFNRKAAEEMRERIQKRCGVDLPVHTFHSLGLDIVGRTEGKRPSLSPLADDTERAAALRRFLDDLLDSAEYRDAVVRFLAQFRYPERYEWEFSERAEYLSYVQAHKPTTLRGERVQSWGELKIADWLTLNGISYGYEAKYPIDLATPSRRQYKPDFTLPGDVYIEYFGVDRNGGTAPGIDAVAYRRGMEWKREVHRRHGTRLIELYAYEAMEGTLESAIAARLQEAGVEVAPLSPDEVRTLVVTPGRIDPLGKMVGTFLTLFRGNLWTLAELRAAGRSRADAARMSAFLDVFEPLLARYEAEAHREGDVDFDDMIARATGYVEEGEFVSPFRRIIVDEFQDISRGRSQLLKALQSSGSDCRLFCVGDDWQSIYRFAGSDISIMTGFAEQFGYTRRTDLDRTFRFGSRLVEISTRFVLRNPHQIRKEINGRGGTGGPAVTVLTSGGAKEDDPLARALQAIGRRERDATPASVLLLGRYRHLEPANLRRLRRDHPDLDIEYRTVHSSKGLEADFVVVRGMVAGAYGFPSEIEDDPVLELVLPTEAGFRHAEERRLFYVALTRAREHVFLCTDARELSSFVTELRGATYRGLVKFADGAGTNGYRCPECNAGDLLLRTSKFGPFWGCSFYPYCTGKARMCQRCGAAPVLMRGSAATCADRACGRRPSNRARSPRR